MFKWFGGLLDRICAVAGALAFSQVPLFMQQYKQQLSGHVVELQLQVKAMRQAAMLTGKTLEQFIGKFSSSTDGDFARQGEIMHAMVLRWQALTDGFTALNEASTFSAPFVFLSHFNLEIAKETAGAFSPGIPLSLEGGVWAVIGIAAGYLLFYTVKRGLRAVWYIFSGGPKKVPVTDVVPK